MSGFALAPLFFQPKILCLLPWKEILVTDCSEITVFCGGPGIESRMPAVISLGSCGNPASCFSPSLPASWFYSLPCLAGPPACPGANTRGVALWLKATAVFLGQKKSEACQPAKNGSDQENFRQAVQVDGEECGHMALCSILSVTESQPRASVRAAAWGYRLVLHSGWDLFGNVSSVSWIKTLMDLSFTRIMLVGCLLRVSSELMAFVKQLFFFAGYLGVISKEQHLIPYGPS